MGKHKSKHEESVTWPELVKKVVFASLGSAAIAGQAVKDGKLHKEVIQNLKTKAGMAKEDLLDVLAHEVSRFLGKINVSEEIQKSLKGLVINLSATIDFDDKKKGLSPTIRVKKAKAKKHS